MWFKPSKPTPTKQRNSSINSKPAKCPPSSRTSPMKRSSSSETSSTLPFPFPTEIRDAAEAAGDRCRQSVQRHRRRQQSSKTSSSIPGIVLSDITSGWADYHQRAYRCLGRRDQRYRMFSLEFPKIAPSLLPSDRALLLRPRQRRPRTEPRQRHRMRRPRAKLRARPSLQVRRAREPQQRHRMRRPRV